MNECKQWQPGQQRWAGELVKAPETITVNGGPGVLLMMKIADSKYEVDKIFYTDNSKRGILRALKAKVGDFVVCYGFPQPDGSLLGDVFHNYGAINYVGKQSLHSGDSLPPTPELTLPIVGPSEGNSIGGPRP